MSPVPGAPTRAGRANVRLSRLAWVAVGILLVVLAWLQTYLVGHETLLGSLLIAAAAVAVAAAATRPTARTAPNTRAAVIALGALVVLAQLVWFLTHWYPAWVTSQASAIVLALAAFALAWTLRPRGLTPLRAVLRVGGAVLVAVAVAVSALVVTTSISPKPVAGAVQRAQGYGNSFDAPAASASTVVQDGATLVNDLQYGTQYPNSYLDIYIADSDPTVDRPTLVYVHGGGWIIGNKTMGDPNAGGATFALANGPMLEAGYNVVTLDYALAPEYTYPTPVIQLSQAITYLQENADQYGLDMDRVVIGGGSAGGHIAAQFAAIQTDPAYAAEVGIPAVMDPAALKAVSLDSAALDGSRASRTQAPDAFSDWEFGLAGRAYFDRSGFMSDADGNVAQANIIEHVSAAYPPTFIADGNYGTFGDQAEDLGARLTQLGVRNQVDVPSLSEAKLGHGYMGLGASPYVDAYNAQKVAFLDSVVK